MGQSIRSIVAQSGLVFGVTFSFVFVGSALVTRSAFAQDEEPSDEVDALAEARSKFQRAIELEQAANYAGALKLYREVGAVRMTPQVRYHIALCEEKLGQLVAALGGYELAMSTGTDMPEAFINEVQTSIDELRARIPKLLIARGEGAEAASIELDGVALGQSSIGVEIPLNPGPHTVGASAPGYDDFRETVSVVEGASETLTITLSPTPEPEPEPVEPPPPPPKEPRFGVLPYVIGGIGLATTVAGGVLLGVSQAKVGSIKKICGGIDCSDESQDDQNEARRLLNAAQELEAGGWVALGVGLAATGAGVVMYYLDSKRTKESSFLGPELRILPVASDRHWGMHMVGRF